MRIGDKVLVTAAHKVGCGYYGEVVGIFGNIDGRPAVDVSGKTDMGAPFGGVYYCDELKVITDSDLYTPAIYVLHRNPEGLEYGTFFYTLKEYHQFLKSAKRRKITILKEELLVEKSTALFRSEVVSRSNEPQ